MMAICYCFRSLAESHETIHQYISVNV